MGLNSVRAREYPFWLFRRRSVVLPVRMHRVHDGLGGGCIRRRPCCSSKGQRRARIGFCDSAHENAVLDSACAHEECVRVKGALLAFLRFPVSELGGLS